MKTFAIIDEEIPEIEAVGYLIYYEKSKTFFIEIPDNIDPWFVPLPLNELYMKGQKTMGSDISRLWVQLRIVPYDRQNIWSILKDNGLNEYDEFELLALADGRCSQDSIYIRQVEALPPGIEARKIHRVQEAIPMTDNRILAFFADGTAKKCDIEAMKGDDRLFSALLNNQDRFDRVTVQPGGYGVCWGKDAVISDIALYNNGSIIDIEYDTFRRFAEKQVINTAEASDIMNCTRQNINDLVVRGKLKPLRSLKKTKLFLRSDVLRRQ